MWVYEAADDVVYPSSNSMFRPLTGSYDLEQMIPAVNPEKLGIWRHRGEILRKSGIPISQGDRISWGWYRHNSEARLLVPVVEAWNHALKNGDIRPDASLDNTLEVAWAVKPDGSPFVASVRFLPDGKGDSPQARRLKLEN